MAKNNSGNQEIQVEQLRYALDNVPAYVYMKDEDSHYLYANKLTLELFGCSEENLVGRSDSDFFPADTVLRLREIDQKVLRGEHTQEEVFIDNPDGSQTIYWEVKTPIYRDSTFKDIVGILGISTDITQRKQLEEQLLQAAITDPLTGLPNRRQFMEQLNRALLKSNRQKTYGAVIFLDLDRFKHLNDNYGHRVGDQYLVEVASRINHHVREYDTVARYGGDEFVVLLEDLGPEEDSARKNATIISNNILNSLNSEYTFSDVIYQGSTSAGVSLFFGTQRTVEEILTEADRYMYEAKRRDK
jgi:diguanylate cyclase (GGDEF)-like protein/PAS domain S-box-containing protein